MLQPHAEQKRAFHNYFAIIRRGCTERVRPIHTHLLDGATGVRSPRKQPSEKSFCVISLVPSHRFNSATGEQKGITQAICTDSELASRLANSLMPSANLQIFTSWCDTVRDRTQASRTLSGRSNHYATEGKCFIAIKSPLGAKYNQKSKHTAS